MNEGLKRVLGVLLAALMTAEGNGVDGVTSSSMADSFNTKTVNASVQMTSDGAIATTNYAKTAKIETVVTVYYEYNGFKYSTQGSMETNLIGDATSTASVGHYGGQVVGAKGCHYITSASGNARWYYETTIGETW